MLVEKRKRGLKWIDMNRNELKINIFWRSIFSRSLSRIHDVLFNWIEKETTNFRTIFPFFYRRFVECSNNPVVIVVWILVWAHISKLVSDIYIILMYARSFDKYFLKLYKHYICLYGVRLLYPPCHHFIFNICHKHFEPLIVFQHQHLSWACT